MPSATVGKLSVLLTASTAKFQEGLKKAKTAVSKLKTETKKATKTTDKFQKKTKKAGKTSMTYSKRLRGVRSGLRGMKALLIGVAVGGFASFVKHQMTTIDALGKTSEKLGITVENLQRLQFVAKQTGVEINTLNMGLQRMIRRISEAAIGTGEAQGAIKELGLDAAILNRAGGFNAFLAIADAMDKLDSKSDKLRLTFKLFDSEGVALINTMGGGAAGIRAMAASLGDVLSATDVKNITAMNDAIQKLQAQLSIRIGKEIAGGGSGFGAAIGELVEFGLSRSFKETAPRFAEAATADKAFADIRKEFLKRGLEIETTPQLTKFIDQLASEASAFEAAQRNISEATAKVRAEFEKADAGGAFEAMVMSYEKLAVAGKMSREEIDKNVMSLRKQNDELKKIKRDHAAAGPTGRTSGPFANFGGPNRKTFAEAAADRERDRMRPFIQAAIASVAGTGPLLASLAVRGSAEANATISRSRADSAGVKRTDEQILEEAKKQREAADKAVNRLDDLLFAFEENELAVVEIGG